MRRGYLVACLSTSWLGFMPEVEVRVSRKYRTRLAKELREAVEDVLEGRTVEFKEFLRKVKEGK